MSDFVQLEARIDHLEARTEELETENECLEARTEELEAENERLESELSEYQEQNERDKAGIRKQIHDLVEVKTDAERPSLEDIWVAGVPLGKIVSNLDGELKRGAVRGDQQHIDHGDRDTDDRSPLAQLVDVPAERATEFLSANQLRGRKIAQRACEIGAKTPEGLVVRSDQITEQLRRWGESSHTETVSRVIDFITDLGGGDVRETMHKGRRILVFEPDRVREYGTGEEPSTIKSHRDVIPARMNTGGVATA